MFSCIHVTNYTCNRYAQISQAAFDTPERAKHWTALHVAQAIYVSGPTPPNPNIPHSNANFWGTFGIPMPNIPHSNAPKPKYSSFQFITNHSGQVDNDDANHESIQSKKFVQHGAIDGSGDLSQHVLCNELGQAGPQWRVESCEGWSVENKQRLQ